MGKAENRKRAKKLKQAKRKKEKEALLESSEGLAIKALKERHSGQGSIVTNNNGKIKYSDLLKKLVEPILHEDDDLQIVKTKFSFGALAWNLAIMGENNKKVYEETKKEMLSMIGDAPGLEQIFSEMIELKHKKFAKYKNIIVDVEIKQSSSNEFGVAVVTAPS